MFDTAEGLLIGFPFGRTVATSVVPAFGGPSALRQLWKIAEEEPKIKECKNVKGLMYIDIIIISNIPG